MLLDAANMLISIKTISSSGDNLGLRPPPEAIIFTSFDNDNSCLYLFSSIAYLKSFSEGVTKTCEPNTQQDF